MQPVEITAAFTAWVMMAEDVVGISLVGRVPVCAGAVIGTFAEV